MLKTRRGDTMIEVMFGVAIFGLIAISSIGLMNNGLATSEANLENTLARDEINAQAEALRFIHSSYAATNGEVYKDLWGKIVGKAADSFDASGIIDNFKDGKNCSKLYNTVASTHSFALQTGSIQNNRTFINKLQPAEHNNSPFPYPTINNDTAYGIWINAIKSGIKDNGNKPYYYDFYIRACWHTTGSNTPTILDTVVRLYNPDRRNS